MSEGIRPESARESERQTARDWFESLDELLAAGGPRAAERLIGQITRRAAVAGARPPFVRDTPYVDTIPTRDEPPYPGDEALEDRLDALVRWNAMALVLRANRGDAGLGGHLGSYASASTLFEVGFNHVFRGHDHERGGDHLFLQGHASPGVYARAFLEGRLAESDLDGFRRELHGGLASYPHPWTMPDFWETPSVSMGLAPLMAIYQARFDRYLHHRGLLDRPRRVFAIIGDGEMDEPESTAGLALAAREGLYDVVFVVDCNLQRLDGPVRGAGKIIQELEARFLGAGWQVIKVLLGRGWDRLLAADHDGALVAALDESSDGHFRKIVTEGGAWMREHFFEARGLADRVADWSDDELAALGWGGHDRRRVLAAYRMAEATDRPTVILAQTVKGHGLGSRVEARNVAHKTKVLPPEAVSAFAERLGLELPENGATEVPLLRPDDEDPALRYLLERRTALGGFRPERRRGSRRPNLPNDDVFSRFYEGSGEREATTTAWLVRLLGELAEHEGIGQHIVPIVPDEARTFGLEALFPRVGIYQPNEPSVEPVDAGALLSYEQSPTGQILEEGITEAGAMGSFIAAGTSHSAHDLPMVPFYLFYSMFGMQRVGDLVWAAGDARARGFLVGATAGRTTLNGEGTQHQDGHSQLIALGLPHVRSWDPAWGYEVAVIVRDGLRRAVDPDEEDGLDYITVANEPYSHPAMPEGAEEGILRGMHRVSGSDRRDATVLASGPLVRTALEAARRLRDGWGVDVDVFSVTSWKGLHDEAVDLERRRRRGEDVGLPWVRKALGDDPGALVAVSDWVVAVPGVLARFLPGFLTVLGTDGFGRSDTREALRDHFEVAVADVAIAVLEQLVERDTIPHDTLTSARTALDRTPREDNPRTA